MPAGPAHYFNWPSLTAGAHLDAVQLAFAFYQGVFSFSGYNYLNFVTEEIREPHK